MSIREAQAEVPVQTLCDAVGLAAVTFASLLLVSACTSSTSPNPVSAGSNGTISGSVSGTTSGGPVTGAISGSISTNGVMGGTISGTIGATSGTSRHQLASAVTFSGSASGTHGGGSVTGTFSGTASNGGTFSGAFSGPIDGSTLTYTASGSLTFSGAVTGTVNVTLNGDCPTNGTPPVVPVVRAGTWSYSCRVGVFLSVSGAPSCEVPSSGTMVVSSSGAFSIPFSVACQSCAASGTVAGTIAGAGVSGSVMESLSGPTCTNQPQTSAALTGSCAVSGGIIQNCQGNAPAADLNCTWTPP
jgi:fibronectin-binding autotransporter adhesin